MTVNCVPLVTRDHMATNGVIHTVAKVLKPVTESLLDIVKSKPELNTLKKSKFYNIDSSVWKCIMNNRLISLIGNI